MDLFQIKNNNQIRNYANDLLSCSIKCLFSRPTRICRKSKTLTDRIYSNSMSNITTSGIMYGYISDHLPIFVKAPIKQSKSVKNINDIKFIRDMSNFVINEFNNDLTEKLNQLNTPNKMSAQKIFDQFIHSFLSTVNKHASLKKASRREKKKKLKP